MANNLKPQNPRNVFQHQSHPSNRQRPRGGVVQDKGAEKSGRAASEQPVPLKNESGARPLSTNLFRVNKLDYTKVKLIHTTSHLHPLVRAELERRADITGLSLSRVMATGLEEWVQYDLHRQHEALQYPMFRQLIRDEFQAFSDRNVHFIMRIAIASEQARILITEVLKRLLYLINQFGKLITWLTNGKKQESKNDSTQSTIETFDTIVEKSYDMARANVFRKSTEMKSMLKDYEAWGKGEKIIKST